MTYDDFMKLMPGIAALLAIIGSILGAYFTFRFNANRNDKIDKINRMESCYIAFHQYYNLITTGIFPWSMVGDDGITYDQANDMFLESAKDSPKDLYPKIRFTVVLLFPELLQLLDNIHRSNDEVLKKIGAAKQKYRETGDASVFKVVGWRNYAMEMDELRNKIDEVFQQSVKLRKLM